MHSSIICLHAPCLHVPLNHVLIRAELPSKAHIKSNMLSDASTLHENALTDRLPVMIEHRSYLFFPLIAHLQQQTV